MLKTTYAIIRYCLQRFCVGAVTLAEKVANKIRTLWTATVEAVQDGINWITNKLQKHKQPQSFWNKCKELYMEIKLQQLLVFIGSFVCCFLFEEARGDLTWFKTMLTSSKDLLQNYKQTIFGLFKYKECGLT